MGKNIPSKVGKSYGDITVLEYLGNLTYKCKCKCGNILNIKTSSLREDKKGIYRCKECQDKKRKEKLNGKKIGIKYGKLTVIEYLGNKNYLCKCDCGKECVVKTYDLRQNKKGAKSCGCEVIHYKKNENFFEKIDTEEKAYILGFIASDGHVNERDNNIKIVLNSKDSEILEKIKQSLSYSGNIKIEKIKAKLPQGGYCESEVAKLVICSKKIVEDLVKIGLTNNKTYNMNFDFSIIPNNLVRHFIRGYWDGDGSCGITRGKSKKIYYNASCIGNAKMMENLIEEIKKFLPNIKFYINYTKNIIKLQTARISVQGKDNFKDFLNFLYKDSKIYLKRKFKNYKESLVILDLINNCYVKSYKDIPIENKEELYTEKYSEYHDFLNYDYCNDYS